MSNSIGRRFSLKRLGASTSNRKASIIPGFGSLKRKGSRAPGNRKTSQQVDLEDIVIDPVPEVQIQDCNVRCCSLNLRSLLIRIKIAITISCLTIKFMNSFIASVKIPFQKRFDEFCRLFKHRFFRPIFYLLVPVAQHLRECNKDAPLKYT